MLIWDQLKEMAGLRQQEFHKDLQWSAEARKLLDDPLLQRFFQETEKSLIEQWQNSKPADDELREVAYRMLLLTRKFKQYFEMFLANEEFARQQLDEIGDGEAA